MTETSGEAGGGWDSVARAISDRLADTQTTQMEIASKAKVSLTTLRELQHNLNPRRRRPQTLAAISEALGWPSDYLTRVLHGRTAQPFPEETDDPILQALDQIRSEIHVLRDRMDAFERRQAAGDGRP